MEDEKHRARAAESVYMRTMKIICRSGIAFLLLLIDMASKVPTRRTLVALTWPLSRLYMKAIGPTPLHQ